MRAGKPVTIYLPTELAERLDAKAKENRRTKTAEVVLALEQYLGMENRGEEVKPKRRRK